MKNKYLSLFAIVMAWVLVTSCTVVPITGRKQMNLLPEATMLEMGLTSYKAFLDTIDLSKNLPSTASVEKVGRNISTVVNNFLKANGQESRLPYFQWEFRLVADKTPNAWCLPGGKVVFYEGILPITKNESGIAVVMGHEIAHAVARHGNERMSQSLLTELGGMALSVAIQTQPAQTQQIFQVAYGLGSQIGVLLPYSRLHEKEADRLGLILMAMAKYDPNEAISFWERMKEINSGNQVPEWLSTHPLDESRIAEMKKNLPEAMKYYQDATVLK